MAFGSFSDDPGGGGPPPMSDINVTPLVDVMLVLLIIFIVTAPLLTHGIRIDLPKASSQANPEQPDTVTIAIEANGKISWNDKLVDDTRLQAVMAEAAGKQPQPSVHIRADRATTYQRLAKIMSMAKKAGLTKLGFVTDPTGS